MVSTEDSRVHDYIIITVTCVVFIPDIQVWMYRTSQLVGKMD